MNNQSKLGEVFKVDGIERKETKKTKRNRSVLVLAEQFLRQSVIDRLNGRDGEC